MRTTTTSASATVAASSISAQLSKQATNNVSAPYYVTFSYSGSATFTPGQSVTVAAVTGGTYNTVVTVQAVAQDLAPAGLKNVTLRYTTDPGTYTSGGTITPTVFSPPVVVDAQLNPPNIAIQAVVTGTVTYNIDGTLDDPFSATFDANTANWISSQTGKTTTASYNYSQPVRAIRVATTAGTGSVALTVSQGTI